MPLSAFRRWWDYISIRGDDLPNHALRHLHEPVVRILTEVYSADD